MMTALPRMVQTAPQKRKYQPNRGGNGPSGSRAGARGANTCQWCGKRLPLTRGSQQRLTCGPSCRSSLSRKKRSTCVNAMSAAFGWKREIGDRLIAACGLPEVELRMNRLGWEWNARLKGWFQPHNANRGAA